MAQKRRAALPSKAQVEQLAAFVEAVVQVRTRELDQARRAALLEAAMLRGQRDGLAAKLRRAQRTDAQLRAHLERLTAATRKRPRGWLKAEVARLLRAQPRTVGALSVATGAYLGNLYRTLGTLGAVKVQGLYRLPAEVQRLPPGPVPTEREPAPPELPKVAAVPPLIRRAAQLSEPEARA